MTDEDEAAARCLLEARVAMSDVLLPVVSASPLPPPILDDDDDDDILVWPRDVRVMMLGKAVSRSAPPPLVGRPPLLLLAIFVVVVVVED